MNKKILLVPLIFLTIAFFISNTVSCGTMGNSQIPIDNSTAIFNNNNVTFVNYFGNSTLVFQIPLTSTLYNFTNAETYYFKNATFNINFTFTNLFNDTWKLTINGSTTKAINFPINIIGNNFTTGVNVLSTNNLIFNYSDSPSNFIFSSSNLTIAKVQLVIPNGTFHIDPSFGNNVTTTSAQTTISSVIQGQKFLFTGGINQSANSISAYLESGTGNWAVTFAIYDNNSKLVGQTQSGVWSQTGVATAWMTLNFSPSISLTNNSNYYLVAWANATSTLIMYASSTGTSYRVLSQTYTGTYPSTLSFSTFANTNPDIYCNYSSTIGFWLNTSINASTGTGAISPNGYNLYPSGTVVSIAITPDIGYYLYDYAYDGSLTYYTNSLSVTMSANHTVTANCVVGLANYTVLGNGTIQEGLSNGTYVWTSGGVTISNYTLLSNGTSLGLSNGTFVNNTFPIISSYTYNSTSYTVTLSNGTIWSGTYVLITGYSYNDTSYLINLSNGTNLSNIYVIVNSFTVYDNGTDTALSNGTHLNAYFPIVTYYNVTSNEEIITLSNGTVWDNVFIGGSSNCTITLNGTMPSDTSIPSGSIDEHYYYVVEGIFLLLSFIGIFFTKILTLLGALLGILFTTTFTNFVSFSSMNGWIYDNETSTVYYSNGVYVNPIDPTIWVTLTLIYVFSFIIIIAKFNKDRHQ